MRRWRARLAVLLAMAAAVVPGGAAEAPLTWGDQGDGTYCNPILPADYSDPDVIRVGDDFYLVASDFHFVGIQVLHSLDLVNWRIIGQVFGRLTMHPKYDLMQGYAQGTWAPSLRYHDGLFYLYVCTPHDGLYRWTARNPAGPWSEMVTIKTVDKWEDPCPFWDDDGQAYLVHGLHGAGPLILHRMNAAGTELLDDGVVIYEGPVAEGPKFYKRDGWYYISLPEGGVEQGGQTVLRSRHIYGPYERRVVLPGGSPHQGGIVDLPNGESWFIGFKSAGHLGRICHLLPVTWGDDGWPVFGEQGRPVDGGRKPGLPVQPISHPQTSDDFSARFLAPQWQWNHNPWGESWSLTHRPGWLRLRGLPASEPMLARNTLTQKLWDRLGVVVAKLDVRRLSDGQRAGLAFQSGKTFDTIGVRRAEGVARLQAGDAVGPAVTGEAIWLRGDYDGDQARFAYSLDGEDFHALGGPVTLKAGQWKGARVALYCYGDGGGFAEFDSFDYRVGDPARSTK